MDIEKLALLIDSLPGQEALESDALALSLNTKTERIPARQPVWVKVRTLYAHALFGPEKTEAIMAKIAKAGETLSTAKRIVGWLDSTDDTGGLDMACAATQSALKLFANLGILTDEEAAALSELGHETVSLAEAHGLGKVYPGHVEKARDALCRQ